MLDPPWLVQFSAFKNLPAGLFPSRIHAVEHPIQKMKLALILTGLCFALGLTACKKAPDTSAASVPSQTAAAPAAAAVAAPSASAAEETAFDPASLPTAKVQLGTFPYIALPDGYSYNGTKTLDYDRFMFAINGKVVPLEGRFFKAALQSTNNGEMSKVFIEKSFVGFMESLGAKKLNDSQIDYKVYELAHYDSEKSDVNIGQITHTYGLKTQEGQPVIFQLGLNGPRYNIMQLKDFKQTMSLLPPEAQADNLQKTIATDGKAVLHINFDTDKASLQADGSLIVDEIAKLLKTNAALKLSIEGHTDNTGSAEHNLALSKDRAVAVRDKLVALGIESARLKTAGFGSDKAVATNDTEANKARNRRVELVKF